MEIIADEAGLIAAILESPDEDLLRLIYADWLEENGRAGSEFLRLECKFHASNGEAAEQLKQELLALVKDREPSWYRQFQRAPIENCEFAFKCPKKWEQLQRTENENQRFCSSCEQRVYFCGDIGTARLAAREGKCVAIDTTLARYDGDLEHEPGSVPGPEVGVLHYD